MEAGAERRVGLSFKIQVSNFKEEVDLLSAIKDWLPITVRNRVALGFAFTALVIFVTWNLLPSYSYGESSPHGIMAAEIWPNVCSPDMVINAIKTPDIDGFLELAATLALIQNGLVLLMILPIWKMLHASMYIRLPLALVNLVGGSVVSWFVFDYGGNMDDLQDLYGAIALCLIALSMISLSVAMLIFKNELGLRQELEVKRMIGGQ